MTGSETADVRDKGQNRQIGRDDRTTDRRGERQDMREQGLGTVKTEPEEGALTPTTAASIAETDSN